MKYKLLITASGIVVAVVVAMAAYRLGRRSVLIEEFKTYEFNLGTFWNTTNPPVLKEYLKGRYYYLGNRIPESWLPLKGADFGPMDSNIVTKLMIGKGPTTPELEYAEFQERIKKLRAEK